MLPKKTYKTGATKRREARQAATEESAKKCHLITSFLKSQQSSSTSSDASQSNVTAGISGESVWSDELEKQKSTGESREPDVEDASGPSTISTTVVVTEDVVPTGDPNLIEGKMAVSESENENDSEETTLAKQIPEYEPVECMLNLQEKYPSDPKHFEDRPLTTPLIRALMAVGPCQPGLKDNFADFPLDSNHRKFNISWYERKCAGIHKVDRHWLVYSPESNRLYCFCCWLFADKNAESYSKTWGNPECGMANFKKGIEKIAKHEKSAIHINAQKQYFMTKYRLDADKTVIDNLIHEEKKRIERNRQILSRLLDCTLFLAKQGLAFRGHREYAGLGAKSENEGNFIELLKLMAKYDTILESHLFSPGRTKRQPMYLSPKLQNEFIECLANECTQQIITEVKAAKYYSVIVDSTIDISHQDQCSVSLRYVSKSGHAQEHFLSFCELESTAAESFYDTLVKVLFQDLSLDAQYIRGQAYDGASNMSGHISGLQARVKEGCSSKAVYVHCCAHNLNLVLIDASQSSVDGKLFFGTLESLYVFLTSSLPRLKILEEEQEKLLTSTVLTLKRLSDTRWFSHIQAVEATINNLPAVISALEKIISGDVRNTAPKVLAEARGLLLNVSKFEFIFMLKFFQNLLKKLHSVSQYLQKEAIDLYSADVMIKNVVKEIEDIRSNEYFDRTLSDAKNLAEQCQVEPEFTTEKRKRKKKRFHDENASDEPHETMSLHFKRDVYFTILDRIISSFNERFADLHDLVKDFSCLIPAHFDDDDTCNRERIDNLAKFYEGDIENDTIFDEYLSFKDFYKEVCLDKSISSSEIVPFMISNDLDIAYPNVFALYKMFITIPVSSAQAERTFSRLKLIKNYLRSTMSEERLNALAMMHIERELAEKIDFSIVIEKFSKVKHRKLEL